MVEAGANQANNAREPAILVGVRLKGVTAWEVEDNLDELEQLLDTAGGVCVERVVQDRLKPDPGTFIGQGKVAQIAGMIAMHGVKLVIFDDDLTPAQVRNLEKHWNCTVLDREGLILDIFEHRARSREARIQVELAHLLYLLPRLTRRWMHLSRQYGGIGARRGPGETQLETDRRVLQKRIDGLREQLAKIERSRQTRRSKRSELYKVALVGYTNAGKSTLLNALARSHAFVEDRLFATLDPLVRSLRLPGGRKVLLIDTVGFIRKLPVGLVATFRSTLEESRQANLFLHLVDLSHSHWEGQLARTGELITELGLDTIPQVLLFNKVDKVKDLQLIEGLGRQYPEALFISALRGIRLYEITERIERFASQRWVRARKSFKPDEADRLRAFEENIRVVGRSFQDGMIHVEYLVPAEQESELLEV